MTDKTEVNEMSEANELDALLEGVEAPSGALAEDVLQSLAAEENMTDEGAADDEIEALAELGDEQEPGGVEVSEAPSAPTIDKNAIYEEQTSNVGVADEETAAPKKGKRNRKGKKAAASKTAPKASKSKTAPKVNDEDGASITTRSAALAKKAEVSALTQIGVDEDDIPALLEGMDNAPKKVSEKAYNFLRYSLGRDHLSNYTRFALEQLAKRGSAGMTVPELVKAMEERGYKPGTARSQSQQMSRLFGIFGMADKTGGKMVLTPDAPLVKAALDRLKVAFVTNV